MEGFLFIRRAYVSSLEPSHSGYLASSGCNPRLLHSIMIMKSNNAKANDPTTIARMAHHCSAAPPPVTVRVTGSLVIPSRVAVISAVPAPSPR